MKHLVSLLIISLATTTLALADTTTSPTEKVVEHHIQSGNDRNIEEVMRDYADDAILIAPGGVLFKGKQAIRTSFEQLMAQDTGSAVVPNQKVFEGEVGYVVWTMDAGTAGAAHGSDTFIVRNGKIEVQTVTIFQPGQDK